jgi:hypothetical protein
MGRFGDDMSEPLVPAAQDTAETKKQKACFLLVSDLFMKVTILGMLRCVVHWAFYFTRSNDPFSTILMLGLGRLNDLNCNAIHGHV